MAPTYTYLAILSIALTVIDIRHKVLPNVLTLTAYPIVLVLLTIPAALEDQWNAWLRATAGSAVTLAIFTALAMFSSGSFGMGDAKLAGVLALPLTWTSWTNTVAAMAGAFVLSALVSVILVALGRANRHSLIPFGPFLIAATWLVIAIS